MRVAVCEPRWVGVLAISLVPVAVPRDDGRATHGGPGREGGADDPRIGAASARRAGHRAMATGRWETRTQSITSHSVLWDKGLLDRAALLNSIERTALSLASKHYASIPPNRPSLNPSHHAS